MPTIGKHEVFRQLASLGESLVARFRKCQRIATAAEGAPGHGPSWSLTHGVRGKTVTRVIPATPSKKRAPRSKNAVACAGTAELIEVSEQWCDARLRTAGARTVRGACAEQFAPVIEAEVERLVGPGAVDELDFERLPCGGACWPWRRAWWSEASTRTAPTMGFAPALSVRQRGRHPKTFETVLGPLTLERAYYYCEGCHKGCFPRDQALGLERTSLSPATVRMTGSAAALVSFAEASGLLAELAGVRVEAKQVERVAEALGREIAAAEREGAVEPEPPSAPTMYLGLDGTGVPVRRAESAGRAGKQPEGTAKTREAKLVLVGPGRRMQGRPVRDPGSVSYSGAIESAAGRDTDPDASAFARRVRREAERRGFPDAAKRVVLGDGAAWIWNLSSEQFPGAIQIVDLWHAEEHLWEVSAACLRRGPGRVATNSKRGAWTICCRSCAREPATASRHNGAPYVERTATGCATRRSGSRACAWLSGVSRRAAIALKRAGMHWIAGANRFIGHSGPWESRSR